jgi:hypothetical protein
LNSSQYESYIKKYKKIVVNTTMTLIRLNERLAKRETGKGKNKKPSAAEEQQKRKLTTKIQVVSQMVDRLVSFRDTTVDVDLKITNWSHFFSSLEQSIVRKYINIILSGNGHLFLAMLAYMYNDMVRVGAINALQHENNNILDVKDMVRL